MELLYTVDEASKILKVNKNFIYTLVKSGELKALKLGRIKIPAIEVKKFVTKNVGMDITDPFNKKKANFEGDYDENVQ